MGADPTTDMRDVLKDRDLSFTDMAKIVGERWQVLPPGERETYESSAAAAKERYASEMASYKGTDSYRQHQEYLADFKARHNHGPVSGWSPSSTGQRRC